MDNQITRRNVLKGAAAATALSAIPTLSLDAAVHRRSIGANDRIRIGIIGCGDRGRNAHMKGINNHLKATNFEIVALADPWRVARETANGLVKEWFGRDAQQFVSYRDLLGVKDLDAVMIASTDIHHTDQLEAAAKAGLHAYVEKPLGVDFKEIKRAVDAVKKAGVTVQVGTQIRSLPVIAGARELYRTGIFGKLSRIEECRNAGRPYWYSYLKDVREEDVDWKEFQGRTKKRPFKSDLWSAWYGYYDYSRGPIPQLGAHFIDLANYITDISFPLSCVCTGTLNPTWLDEHEFTCPSVIQATWVYEGGFIVSSSNNMAHGGGNVRKIYGDQGTLDITNWSRPVYDCEGAPKRDGKIRGKNEVEAIERPDHFLDWLQCMRSGDTPNASIDAGYQHAVSVLMAQISYESGRKTIYDPVKRTIRTA